MDEQRLDRRRRLMRRWRPSRAVLRAPPVAAKLFGRYPSLNTQTKILAFAAVVEVGTGLVLIVDPAIVVTLLLGAEVSGAGTLLGRCFGIALLALGLACWPSRQRAERGSPAFRAMLIYNLLIALYLAYLGTVRHLGGSLLWPGVALHAVVALLLAWTWHDERRTSATNK